MDDCYTPERFVEPQNLSDMVEWFDSKISELVEFQITQLLWLLGPADSGKSWLASYLFLKSLNELALGHTIFLAFGDYCPLKVNDNCIFHIPPDQQRSKTFAKIRELQGWFATVMNLQTHVTALPVDRALGQLLTHTDSESFFIVIDGIDESDVGFLKAFEEYFLQPFYNVREHCVILLTSRQLHTWKDVKLRQFPACNIRVLQAFTDSYVDSIVLRQENGASILATELGEILKPSAYPGHIVKAVELWQKYQDVCQVFNTMVNELWQETGLNLPLELGFHLANTNSGFTRGQLQELLMNSLDDNKKIFPFKMNQKWIETLRSSRILYFDSVKERWMMDCAYKHLFNLCRQYCKL